MMPIQIDEITRSRRKTLALIVRPDGSLIVRAPLRASDKAIHEFVIKNAGWIEKKQSQARAAVPPLPRQYLQGDEFMYLGNAYSLELVKDQWTSLLLDGSFKLAESAQGEAELVFELWYRDQARKLLSERVEIYSSQHGFRYQKIGITSARTRWGSCSVTGSLNFSWRLIMAPMEVVDYVVLHELVHTVIHNHSRKFWKRLEEIMPDYREHRNWLKKNGRRLLA